MSDSTREALDAAIRAHAAEEWDGDLVVDWAIVAATIDTDNLTGIGLINSREPMPAYITKGLLIEAMDDIRAGEHDYDEGD
ncbi:hypothetical protein [Microbacterium plantarum]|uniref:hypothetical protein n=1 Tax=Microbacterium plantarum TaxID=1816425 RepID=UPI002B4A3898|nr:hypothetical protein [Microbacterium plantarum]WRK16513.1 hypothetical protein VC184_11400 [Microbacterium plantarum]